MDYEKYLVRKPVYESCSGFKNRQSPTMTYMSKAQVSEANCYLELGWISGLPEPNPHISEHVHDFDEIIMHLGGDPNASRDLGVPTTTHALRWEYLLRFTRYFTADLRARGLIIFLR